MTVRDPASEDAALRPVELRSPSGQLEAAFVPGAGMIGWSIRHRGSELLAHPHPLRTYLEQRRVTALPLLHPWANRLASPEYEIEDRRVTLNMAAPNVHTDPNGLPIHGLVAGCSYWELVERGPARIKARLDFASRPELLEGFPFPHVLELVAELADERLRVDTTLIPTADAAVPVAFGFHPFLRIPDLPRDRWFLELPVTSRVELDDKNLPTGRSTPVEIPPGPLGERTFDDAFDGLVDSPVFAISGAGRRVSLRFLDGYRFAQVYAPPGKEFICFEPMTAPINPFESDRTRLAQPGSSYTARFEIAAA